MTEYEAVEISIKAYRKKVRNEYNFRLPTWALVYIVNGDQSHLTDEEVQAVDDFLTEYKGMHFIVPDDEPFFTHKNDIDGYVGCNVMDVIGVMIW